MKNQHFIQSLRDLVRKCQDHTNCMASSWLPDKTLPRCCIHLNGGSVRLVETGRATERYLALSHRWMPDTELSRTTTENYDERIAGREAEDQFRNSVCDSPLMGRAWVFQEYYLSQRFVCISNIGMWFECRTVVPENDLGDVVLWRENRMPRRGDMAYGTKLFIERHDADTSNWTDLASRYSGLALTKPSDRIAALLASRQTMPTPNSAQPTCIHTCVESGCESCCQVSCGRNTCASSKVLDKGWRECLRSPGHLLWHRSAGTGRRAESSL